MSVLASVDPLILYQSLLQAVAQNTYIGLGLSAVAYHLSAVAISSHRRLGVIPCNKGTLGVSKGLLGSQSAFIAATTSWLKPMHSSESFMLISLTQFYCRHARPDIKFLCFV